MPDEDLRQGDYLLIEDNSTKRRMVAQAYEETYLELPGLAEEILRDEVVGASLQGLEDDSLDVRGMSHLIRDSRVLRCKVRGSVQDSRIKPSITWLPSRVHTKLKKLSMRDLFDLAGRRGHRRLDLGHGATGEPVEIFAESLDGRLNIITGKKESGKSHLAKLLAGGLARMGATVIVLDLNDEYGGLALTRSGTSSSLSDKIVHLVPGRTLKFELRYLGLHALCNVLQHALDIPGASLREFIRIWRYLAEQGSLDSESLGNAIASWKSNEFVRDALISRYHTLRSSGLIGDRDNSQRIEDLIQRFSDGGLIVISLADIPPLTRRLSVEVILSKLVDLLESETIRPVFLFAEEAHLYLRETYWDDIVTRMRHFGIFTTFITNQPDAIANGIYRQADNIFLFNFTNDSDIDLVSRASVVDAETVKSIVRTLPPRSCLVLGKVVNDLPVVVEVNESSWTTLGETKLFFREPLKTIARFD